MILYRHHVTVFTKRVKLGQILIWIFKSIDHLHFSYGYWKPASPHKFPDPTLAQEWWVDTPCRSVWVMDLRVGLKCHRPCKWVSEAAELSPFDTEW